MISNVFTFFSLNEKVGKTISCIIFALILAKKNFKILVLDLDAKSDLTKHFNKTNKIDGFYKFLVEQKDLKHILIKTGINNLDLINASIDTAYLISNNFSDDYLIKIKKLFLQAKQEYDFIFVDTSSLNNLLNEIILINSEQIIWPLVVDKYSYEKIKYQLGFLNNIKQKNNINLLIDTVYFNFFDKNNTLMFKYCHEIVKIFNDSLFHSYVNNIKELFKLKTINEISDYLFKTNELNNFKLLVEEFLNKQKIKKD